MFLLHIGTYKHHQQTIKFEMKKKIHFVDCMNIKKVEAQRSFMAYREGKKKQKQIFSQFNVIKITGSDKQTVLSLLRFENRRPNDS